MCTDMDKHQAEAAESARSYDVAAIEARWQKRWAEQQTFRAAQPGEPGAEREKFYCLVEFPYPSGDGLHVGHPRSYTALDAVARYKRLEGFNVLYPMGWDAFGLPTENYAIKHRIHPAIVTERNVARFKQQLQSLGYAFDWSREVNTTDPSYYRWTQWIFLQLWKQGLAYKKEMAVNWCTSCRIVLANEEVVGGVCERCGGEVVQKVKSQWMLRITDYAERLLDDLDELDFIERVKIQQRNWIGRSTGVQLRFATNNGEAIEVFTTRADTLWGATYMVLSPEHALVTRWLEEGQLENAEAVEAYREQAAHKTDFERTEINKSKDGVELVGVRAINPVTEREIPIYISDYVLASYGTGAIMAVPGHDERDWAFAKEHGLEIIEVVSGGDVAAAAYTDIEEGTMVNSDWLDGMPVAEAQRAIADWIVERGLGEEKVNYKLRDWVFSRQRYWGEPIPMVHCKACGWVPLPESELPLLLPEVDSYMPTEDGSSPLAALPDWVATSCPACGGPAERETDTMPQWAGSSWYFLRYMDAHNDEALASPEALAYWSPVDWYNGGMEHTTLHLLYSRFWHKFLFDIGVVPSAEPYRKRTSHGMILGENGEKMSKSRGNVVNPDDIVERYGADTMRLYEMFIGDFEKPAPWNPTSIRGCRRFLDRVWQLGMDLVAAGEDQGEAREGDYRSEVETLMHQTIRKVGQDIMDLKGNTAIAQLMTLVNRFYELDGATRAELRSLLLLLNPMAPHLTEELWVRLNYGGELNAASWPRYDEAKCVEATVEIPVQINGKLRARLQLPRDIDAAAAIAAALADARVQKALDGRPTKRELYVPGRIINLVV